MKICKTCKIEKELNDFPNHKIMKDGKSAHCKLCKSLKQKEEYSKNSEIKKAKASEYYKKNREKILNSIDKEKQKERKRIYEEKNVEYIKFYREEYRKLNKDKITQYNKEYKKANRAKIQQAWNKRLKEDPLFKLRINLSKRLNEALRNKDSRKNKSTLDHLGCSLEELYNYIEAQFREGMTWDNYGTYWHLDHIIPLSAAKNESHIYELSHYKNLQPMKAIDNLIKNDKITKCWQKFQKDKNLELDQKAGFPFDLNIADLELNVESLSDEHRDFIKKYEWLGTVGYGVRWVFTARWNNKLAGVVMMSEPNSYQFGEVEALIQRGAVSSWAPKNLNSRLVMFGCNWMAKNTNKRIFTAYSDPDAGEIGTIYQACNFDYLGQQFGATEYYQLPNGKLVGSRYFTRTSAMKKWAKELGIVWKTEWVKPNGYQIPDLIPQEIKDYAKMKMKECSIVRQNSKGKYVLLINYGKNKLSKTWEKKPYPKR